MPTATLTGTSRPTFNVDSMKASGLMVERILLRSIMGRNVAGLSDYDKVALAKIDAMLEHFLGEIGNPLPERRIQK